MPLGFNKEARFSRSGLSKSEGNGYEPFWQTVSASPWNVNSPFTDVLGGAPK
jgi:hypothetical protein